MNGMIEIVLYNWDFLRIVDLLVWKFNKNMFLLLISKCEFFIVLFYFLYNVFFFFRSFSGCDFDSRRSGWCCSVYIGFYCIGCYVYYFYYEKKI